MICKKEVDTKLSWFYDEDALLVQLEKDNGKIVLDGTFKDFLEYLTYERLFAGYSNNQTGKVGTITVRV